MSFLKTFSKRADEPFRPDPIVEDEVQEEVPAAPVAPAPGTAPSTPSLGLGEIKAEPLEPVEIPEVTVDLGTAELAKNLEALDTRRLLVEAAQQGATEPIKALRETVREREKGATIGTGEVDVVKSYLKDPTLSDEVYTTAQGTERPIVDIFTAPAIDLPPEQMQRLQEEGRQIKKVRTFEDITVDVLSSALKNQYIKNAGGDKKAGAAKYRKDLQALADSGALGRYEDGSSLSLRDVETALTREYGRRMESPKAAQGVNLLLSIATAAGEEAFNALEDTRASRLTTMITPGGNVFGEDPEDILAAVPLNVVADAVERNTAGTRPSFSDLKVAERPEVKAFAALPAEDQSLVQYASAMGLSPQVLAGVSQAESDNTPTALAFNLDEAREFMTPEQVAILDKNLSEKYGYVRPAPGTDEPLHGAAALRMIEEVRAVSPQAAARATAFGQFQVLGETGNILGLAREAVASEIDRELTDDEAAEVAFQLFKEQPRVVSFMLADRWWKDHPKLKEEVNRGDFSNLVESYTGAARNDGWTARFNKGASRLDLLGMAAGEPPEEALVSTAGPTRFKSGVDLDPSLEAQREQQTREAETDLLSLAGVGRLLAAPLGTQQTEQDFERQTGVKATQVESEALDFEVLSEKGFMPNPGTAAYEVSVRTWSAIAEVSPERARRLMDIGMRAMGRGFDDVRREVEATYEASPEKLEGLTPEEIRQRMSLEALDIITSMQVAGVWHTPVYVSFDQMMGKEEPEGFFEALSPRIEVVGRAGDEIIFRSETGSMQILSAIDAIPIIGQSYNIGVLENYLAPIMGTRLDELKALYDDPSVQNLAALGKGMGKTFFDLHPAVLIASGELSEMHQAGVRGVSGRANFAEFTMDVTADLTNWAVGTDIGMSALRSVTDETADDLIKTQDSLRLAGRFAGMAPGLLFAVIHPDAIGGTVSAFKGLNATRRALLALPDLDSALDPAIIGGVKFRKLVNGEGLNGRQLLFAAGDKRLELTGAVATDLEDLSSRLSVDDAVDIDRVKTILERLPINEAAMSVLDTADANRRDASPGIMNALDLATDASIGRAAEAGDAASAVLLDTKRAERIRVLVEKLAKIESDDPAVAARAAELSKLLESEEVSSSTLTLGRGAARRATESELDAKDVFSTGARLRALRLAVELFDDVKDSFTIRRVAFDRLMGDLVPKINTKTMDELGLKMPEGIDQVTYLDAPRIFGAVTEAELDKALEVGRYANMPDADKAKIRAARAKLEALVVEIETAAKSDDYAKSLLNPEVSDALSLKVINSGLIDGAEHYGVIFRNVGRKGNRFNEAVRLLMGQADRVAGSSTLQQDLFSGIAGVLSYNLHRGNATQQVARALVDAKALGVADDADDAARLAVIDAFLRGTNQPSTGRRLVSAVSSGTREGLLNLIGNTPFFGRRSLKMLGIDDAEIETIVAPGSMAVRRAKMNQMTMDGADPNSFAGAMQTEVLNRLLARRQAIIAGLDEGEDSAVSVTDINAAIDRVGADEWRAGLVSWMHRSKAQRKAGEEVTPFDDLPIAIDISIFAGGGRKYRTSQATKDFVKQSGFLKAYGFAGEETRSALRLGQVRRTRKKKMSGSEQKAAVAILDQMVRFAAKVDPSDSTETVNLKMASWYNKYITGVRRSMNKSAFSRTLRNLEPMVYDMINRRVEEILGAKLEDFMLEALTDPAKVKVPAADDLVRGREALKVDADEASDGNLYEIFDVIAANDGTVDSVVIRRFGDTEAQPINVSLDELRVLTGDARRVVDQAFLEAKFVAVESLLPILTEPQAVEIFKVGRNEMMEAIQIIRAGGVRTESVVARAARGIDEILEGDDLDAIQAAGFTRLFGPTFESPQFPGVVLKIRGADSLEAAMGAKYSDVAVRAAPVAGGELIVAERVTPLDAVEPDRVKSLLVRNFGEDAGRALGRLVDRDTAFAGGDSDLIGLSFGGDTGRLLRLRSADSPEEIAEVLRGLSDAEADEVVTLLSEVGESPLFRRMAALTRKENLLPEDLLRYSNIGVDDSGRIKMLDIESQPGVFDYSGATRLRGPAQARSPELVDRVLSLSRLTPEDSATVAEEVVEPTMRTAQFLDQDQVFASQAAAARALAARVALRDVADASTAMDGYARRLGLAAAADAYGGSGAPRYLDGVIDYLRERRAILKNGEVSTRDFVKSWLITAMSQRAQEKSVEATKAAFARQGIDLNDLKGGVDFDDAFTTGGKVRPEEAAAAWLLSPTGQRFLDDYENGIFNQQAYNTLVEIRNSPFGAAQGMKQMAGKSTSAGKSIADIDGVNEVLAQVNAAKGDYAKLNQVLTDLKFIQDGKSGFIKHFLGLGDTPTVDERAVVFWLDGRLSDDMLKDFRFSVRDQSEPGLFSDVAAARKKILASASDVLRDRILGRMNDLQAAGVGADLEPEVAAHILHHWIWDTVGDTPVTHEGLYTALRLAQMPDGAQSAAAAGARGADEVAEARRLWEELGTESPYFKRWFGESKVVDDEGQPLVVYHGTPFGKFSDKARRINIERAADREAYEESLKVIADLNARIEDQRKIQKSLRKQANEAFARAKSREDELREPWRKGKYGNIRFDDLYETDKAWKAATREARRFRAEASSVYREKEAPLLKQRDAAYVSPPLDDVPVKEDVFRTVSSGQTDFGYRSSGAYFTDSRGIAEGYAQSGTGPLRDPFVYETYLSFKNPYINGVTEDAAFTKEFGDNLKMIMDRIKGMSASSASSREREIANTRRRLLQKYGYDSEIWPQRDGSTEYIAFEPTQIKSVDNRGTFDPQDARLLFQRDDAIPQGWGIVDVGITDPSLVNAEARRNRLLFGVDTEVDVAGPSAQKVSQGAINMEKTETDPVLRQIFTVVSREVGDTEMDVVSRQEFQRFLTENGLSAERADGAAGVFLHSRTRNVTPRILFREDRLLPDTVAHEMLHAATTLKLEREFDDATELSKEFVALSQAVISQAAKSSESRVRQIGKIMSELSDRSAAGELIAYGLSDTAFRDFLRQASGTGVGRKNLYEKFIDGVRKVLGLNDDETSALSELLARADDLLMKYSSEGDVSFTEYLAPQNARTLFQRDEAPKAATAAETIASAADLAESARKLEAPALDVSRAKKIEDTLLESMTDEQRSAALRRVEIAEEFGNIYKGRKSLVDSDPEADTPFALRAMALLTGSGDTLEEAAQNAGSLRSLIDLMEAGSSSPSARTIARRIRTLIPEDAKVILLNRSPRQVIPPVPGSPAGTPSTIIPDRSFNVKILDSLDQEYAGTGISWGGFYRPEVKSLVLKANDTNDSTILHEALHAATLNATARVRGLKEGDVSSQVREAYQSLEQLTDQVRSSAAERLRVLREKTTLTASEQVEVQTMEILLKPQALGVTPIAAMNPVDELITYGFTMPNVIEFLKTVRVETSKGTLQTAFSQFVQLVRRLIVPDSAPAAEITAFDELIRRSDVFFDAIKDERSVLQAESAVRERKISQQEEKLKRLLRLEEEIDQAYARGDDTTDLESQLLTLQNTPASQLSGVAFAPTAKTTGAVGEAAPAAARVADEADEIVPEAVEEAKKAIDRQLSLGLKERKPPKPKPKPPETYEEAAAKYEKLNENQLLNLLGKRGLSPSEEIFATGPTSDRTRYIDALVSQDLEEAAGVVAPAKAVEAPTEYADMNLKQLKNVARARNKGRGKADKIKLSQTVPNLRKALEEDDIAQALLRGESAEGSLFVPAKLPKNVRFSGDRAKVTVKARQEVRFTDPLIPGETITSKPVEITIVRVAKPKPKMVALPPKTLEKNYIQWIMKSKNMGRDEAIDYVDDIVLKMKPTARDTAIVELMEEARVGSTDRGAIASGVERDLRVVDQEIESLRMADEIDQPAIDKLLKQKEDLQESIKLLTTEKPVIEYRYKHAMGEKFFDTPEAALFDANKMLSKPVETVRDKVKFGEVLPYLSDDEVRVIRETLDSAKDGKFINIATMRAVAGDIDDDRLTALYDLMRRSGMLKATSARRGTVELKPVNVAKVQEAIEQFFDPKVRADRVLRSIDLFDRVNMLDLDMLTRPERIIDPEVRQFVERLKTSSPAEYNQILEESRDVISAELADLTRTIDQFTRTIENMKKTMPSRASSRNIREAAIARAEDRVRQLKINQQTLRESLLEGDVPETIDLATEAARRRARDASRMGVDGAEPPPPEGTIPGSRIPSEPEPEMPKGMVYFYNDTSAILYAFKQADISTGLHEMSHVLRRQLDEADLKTVTRWVNGQLQKEGMTPIKLADGPNGRLDFDFRSNPESVIMAEELFARAFERYLREGETPNSLLRSAFAAMRDVMFRIYATIRGRDIDVYISPEMYDLFDKVFGAKKQIDFDDLLNGPQDFLDMQEQLTRGGTRRLTARIAEQEQVEDTFVESYRQMAASLADYRARGIGFRGPQRAAELTKGPYGSRTGDKVLQLGPISRRMLTLEEIGKAREAGKLPVRYQAADYLSVTMASGLEAVAYVAMFGGDSSKMLRLLPPNLRSLVGGYAREHEEFSSELSMRMIDLARRSPRQRAQGVRDLINYARGEQVRMQTGAQRGQRSRANLINTEDHFVQMITSFFDKLSDESRAAFAMDASRYFDGQNQVAGALSGFWRGYGVRRGADPDFDKGLVLSDDLDELLRQNRPEATEQELSQLNLEMLDNLYNAISGLDTGIPKGQKIDASAEALAAEMAFLSGATSVKRGGVTFTAFDLDNERSFFDYMFFGGKIEKDGQVLKIKGINGLTAETPRRAIGTLGIAFQAGHIAGVYDDMRRVGFGVTAADQRLFSRYLSGYGASMSTAELARAQELFRRFGRTKFVPAPDSLGNFYVPQQTRVLIAEQQKQALRQMGLGKTGSASGFFSSALAFYQSMIIFGSVFQRQAFKFMSTLDLGLQVGLTVGGKEGAASAARASALTLLSALGAERVAEGSEALTRAAYSIAGKTMAPEMFKAKLREAVTKRGDEMVNAITDLMGISKYRVEVNPIIENTDAVYIIGGRIYTAKSLRKAFTQAGMYSNAFKEMRQDWWRGMPAADLEQQPLSGPNRRFFDSAKQAAKDFLEAPVQTGVAAARRAGSTVFEHGLESADAWSDLERTGAAVTLMEFGYSPRDAAKIVVESVYDYRGSMTELDRGWARRLLMPFWAFRKNANAQALNMMASPQGAFRIMALRRAVEFGPEALTNIIYEGLLQPYDVDVSVMPPRVRDAYYQTRMILEMGFGDDPGEEVLAEYRANLPPEAKDISDEELLDYEFDGWTIRSGFKGYNNVPERFRIGFRAIISGNTSSLVRQRTGLYRISEALTQQKVADFYVQEGGKMAARAARGETGLPAWAAKRPTVQVPIPVLNESCREIISYLQKTGMTKRDVPDPGDSLYFIMPDNFIMSAVDHAGALLATTTVLAQMAKKSAGIDSIEGVEPPPIGRGDFNRFLNATTPIVDIRGGGSAQLELIKAVIDLVDPGGLTPRQRLHPIVARLLEDTISVPMPHDGDKSLNSGGSSFAWRVTGAAAAATGVGPFGEVVAGEGLPGKTSRMYARPVKVVARDAQGRTREDPGFDLATAKREVEVVTPLISGTAFDYTVPHSGPEGQERLAYTPYLYGASAIVFPTTFLGQFNKWLLDNVGDGPIETSMLQNGDVENELLNLIGEFYKLVGGRVAEADYGRTASIERVRE